MSAGVLLSVTHGDKVEKGQTLAKLYAKDRAGLLADEASRLAAAFSLSSENPAPAQMILEAID